MSKIQGTFSSTTAASVTKTGEEYLRQMMRCVAEYNDAAKTACEQFMQALMEANGVTPATHYVFVNVNDIPPHWRQHMPEYVRFSAVVKQGNAYFADRKTFDLIAGS